jgi:anthranilate phosphoribosyltransferase
MSAESMSDGSACTPTLDTTGAQARRAPSTSTDAAGSDGGFYARAIRRLGRNARPGAAILDADDMARVWRRLLATRLSPSQEAAVLMGLRVHGEDAAMLAACARVAADFCVPMAGVPGRAVVVLTCLGTARRLPVLAPLLALRLAALDVPALLVTHDAARGANAAGVLQALDIAPAADGRAADAMLAATRLAWLPVDALSPALARVLALRAELGFRNTAHASIKLLAAVPRAVLVANYTHAPYRAAFAAAAERLGRSALLVRGTEGDPVAWEAAAHPSLAWVRGVPATLPDRGAATTPALADSDLPPAADVAATARYIARAQRHGACPPAIERQAQQLRALARAAEAG